MRSSILVFETGAGQIGTMVSTSKSGQVRPGEYISKIGPKQIRVGDKDMEETIQIIKSSKRPLEIWFVKIRNKPVDNKKKKKEEEQVKSRRNSVAIQMDALNHLKEDSDEEDQHGAVKGGHSSKFKWVVLEDLNSTLLPIDIFNKALLSEKEVEEFDEWLDNMADRLDQWASAIVNEVMKAASAMQKS